MRMPVNELFSNGAYMVMAALAWNLKSWYGLIVPDRERRLELVKAEFRRFLNAIMWIPCQVVRMARRIIYRVLGCNGWLFGFWGKLAPAPANYDSFSSFANTSGSRTSTQRPWISKPARRRSAATCMLTASVSSYSPRGDFSSRAMKSNASGLKM